MFNEAQYLQKRKDSIGKIDVFTHGFRVTTKDPRVATSCRITLKDWAVYGEKMVEKPNGTRVKEKVLQQTYGAALPGNEVFWFHKGQFKDFQHDLLRYNLTPEDFHMEKMEAYKPKIYDLKMQENRVPYPYQVEAKDFALEPVKDGDHFSKLIAIPPGGGKTLSICFIASHVKQRFIIGVLKKYDKKWLDDFAENLQVKPKQMMKVDKTDQLRGIIDLCKREGAKKLPPLMVITLSTLRSFIDSYETDPEYCVEDYGCAPHELWELLDCGLFGIDEAHEHLNSVFKVAMYMHGPKLVALSGTMRTEDAHQEKLQQTLFPNFKRFEGVKPKKYNHLEFISYSFNYESVRKIKYQAFGRTDYSHAVFEQSIMRHPVILRDYLEMCVCLIDFGYARLYQKGDKCIIFVGIVEMADKFMTCLTAHFPHLNVVRYCKSEGDKYEDMMKGDVIVTTIQSGGTGIDVKGLTYLGFFSMVNSSKSNIQTFYRVREFPGRETRVSMPFNRQNPKHIKYTQFRHELFKDMAKTIETFNYNKQLG